MMGLDKEFSNDRARRTPKSWIDTIIPGDIIALGKRKRHRIVRSTRRDRWGCVRSIEVLKVQRSQYPSPTAIVLRSEMYPGGNYCFHGIVGHRSHCSTKLECEVQSEIDQGISGIKCRVTQDDVVGVLI